MKSCGTCKWWGHAGKQEHERIKVNISACNFPLPDLPVSFIELLDQKRINLMWEVMGVNCKTWHRHTRKR